MTTMRKTIFASLALLALSAGPVLAQGAPQGLIDQAQQRTDPSVLQAERNSGPSDLAQAWNWLFNGSEQNAPHIARAPVPPGQAQGNG